MSRENQIEEMAADLCLIDRCKHLLQEECNMTTCAHCEAEALYNAGYRKQSELADLRVEITTDDFRNIKLAKERELYRKRFFCPNCDLLIKTESWDGSINHMFGESTVLKDNSMPIFCPRCGAKMKGV